MSSKIIYKLTCRRCKVNFSSRNENKLFCTSACQNIWKKEQKVPESHIKYSESNADEWVECVICSYRTKFLGTHYTKVHGLRNHGYVTKSKQLLDLVKGPKNPWFNHGGKLSPWSSSFVGYNDEEERRTAIENMSSKRNKTWDENNSLSTRIGYWLNLGYDEETAIKKLAERQATFSLEKCISKFGEVEGTIRWKERQEKWQQTLSDLSPEEKQRIGRARTEHHNSSISSFERKIFIELSSYFPSLESQITIKESTKRWFIFDFALGNKLIEFNGDYWHANPKLYKEDWVNSTNKKTAGEIWKSDKEKIDFAIACGYEVLVIWESDFKTNPYAEINKCFDFLSE